MIRGDTRGNLFAAPRPARARGTHHPRRQDHRNVGRFTGYRRGLAAHRCNAANTRDACGGSDVRQVQKARLAENNRTAAIPILQNVAAKRGDTERAEALILEEIELRRKRDPSDPELGRALADAGMLYMQQRRFEEAEAFTRQALSIDARALGEDDPRYALKLENLANITYRRKDYDRALEMLERVREIRARNLGDDHILVARTVANMAVVANDSGRPERALELFDEALPRFVAGSRRATPTSARSA